MIVERYLHEPEAGVWDAPLPRVDHPDDVAAVLEAVEAGRINKTRAARLMRISSGGVDSRLRRRRTRR